MRILWVEKFIPDAFIPKPTFPLGISNPGWEGSIPDWKVGLTPILIPSCASKRRNSLIEE